MTYQASAPVPLAGTSHMAKPRVSAGEGTAYGCERSRAIDAIGLPLPG